MFLIDEAPTFILIINILLILLVVFWGRRRSARSTMMWVMVMSIFPIAGFIFYLFMGSDMRRSNMFSLKNSEDKKVREITTTQLEEWKEGKLYYSDVDDYNELIAINLKTDNSILMSENECDLFFDGKEKFRSLLHDIDHAKESIDIQYYIVHSDELGKRVMQHLMVAAQKGVKVRFLVDAVGGRRLKQSDVRAMENSGCEVSVFFPSYFQHINLRFNYRNHRKIVVIDNKIGYIGGFNVGDEYLGQSGKFGYWRDTHIRISGSAAAALKIRFLQDWYYASGKDPENEPEFQIIPHKVGNIPMQLVTSGPDTTYHNIKHAMLKMIYSANKSIYIQTPYLIPDDTFMEALIIAITQGVEVNIMIPNKPDHPIVYWATTSYAGELIQHGAKVYKYNNGFLHAKVMMIDDTITMIGSANMDERSFSLNFEASEIIYSEEISKKIHKQFYKDVKYSTLISKSIYEKRSLIQRIKEPIARLFSPIL